MNAAEYLLAYFGEKNAAMAEDKGFDFPSIVQALEEMEKCLDSWERQNKEDEDIPLLRECLERCKRAALTPFIAGSGLSPNIFWTVRAPSRPVDALMAGDVLGLRAISKRMSESSLSFSEGQREKISDLLINARKVLSEVSDTFPTGLALYLSRLMTEVETALAEYEITGDFILEKAFSRLREALDIAIAQTSEEKSGRWDKIKDALREIAIGFVISAPDFVLTAAQVFPQIGS